MTVTTDAGSELPADFAEVATVRVASLAEAGEVTLGVAGMGAAESVSLADAADGFSDVVTEQITVGGSGWTAVVPVNMVNVQTDTFGDDRFLASDVAFRWFDRIGMIWLIGNAQSFWGMIVTVLRTVVVGHPVNLIFMTPEIMKKSGNRILLRRPRVIGLPIACMKTENLCISRMLLDRSLLQSHSP